MKGKILGKATLSATVPVGAEKKKKKSKKSKKGKKAKKKKD